MTKQEILNWIDNHKGSQSMIEKKAGICERYLTRVKNGGISNPRLQTLKQISEAIKEIEHEYK